MICTTTQRAHCLSELVCDGVLLSCLTHGGMYELLIDVLSLQQSASHDVVVVAEFANDSQ